MRSFSLFFGLLLMSASAHAQLTCPDIDGGSVFSNEDVPIYLGFIGTSFALNSINNQSGAYGSQSRLSSVRNQFGRYGSSSTIYSAQNQFATRPPRIIKQGVFVAYLSNNNALPYTTVSLQALDESCAFSASSPAPFYALSAPPSPPPPPPPPPANDASFESTFSGLWFNPEQDGHGLSISVHSPDSVTVYWYTYDPFGVPIWIIAAGQFVGDTIVADAYYFFGMQFGSWDVNQKERLDWGSIEVQFTSCTSGTMWYDSDLVYDTGEEFGSGLIPLTRLASVEGRECQ